jgi:hypothetical protein
MTDIIAMARKALVQSSGFTYGDLPDPGPAFVFYEKGLERFAALVAAAERNKLAQWMINCSYATGHGDTTEDLLKELEWQVRESERNACAAIARQWDVDHQGSNYGGCIARLIEARGQA